ncbi:hypothetical protein ACXX82_00990 [Glaciimonas sp. GNP009]
MNRPISRYLTAQKFNWLLADDGLYLGAAADQSDKDEGKYDHTLLSRLISQKMPNTSAALLRDLDKLQLGMQDFKRTDSYLSCWYLGAEESQQMWDEFGMNGVLVVSDSWTIQDALPEPLKYASKFPEVTYDDVLKVVAGHDPLSVKNECFVDEQEFRLVFDLTHYSILTGFESRTAAHVGDKLSHLDESVTSGMSKTGIEQSHNVIRRKGSGLILDYSLNALMKEVRLHPSATEEELLHVERRLRDKGIHCPVRHSSLCAAEL